jgi:electron transfer flavoprotein alpha subunit
MPCIIALCEQSDGTLKKVATEVASEALRQGQAAGLPVAALTIGPGAAVAAVRLGEYGIESATALEAAGVASYSGEAYAAALAAAIKGMDAALVLLGATSFARDLLGRLGALLSTSPAPDCIALSSSGGSFKARRPVYAGKAILTVKLNGRPALASLRPNVFAATKVAGKTTRVETLVPAAAPARCGRLVNRVAAGSGRIELAEAEVVVSGGRGLKTPENFKKLVEPLAAALGAAVGASRAVVDAGWRPHSEQVGQTGRTVSPKLYFACGISGAIQHLAGMRTARTIVAINKDKEAPIFKVADYGIVGDVDEVLPVLTEQAKALKRH